MKNLTKKMMLIGMLLITSICVFAQGGEAPVEESENVMDGILKWITGGGLVTLIVIMTGFWKKGVDFIGKVGGGLFDLLGGLGDILVQSTEANTKIRGAVSKLKVYAADGKFTKEEVEDLIKHVEEAVKEAEDVPVAIKAFKDIFTKVVASFRK